MANELILHSTSISEKCLFLDVLKNELTAFFGKETKIYTRKETAEIKGQKYKAVKNGWVQF